MAFLPANMVHSHFNSSRKVIGIPDGPRGRTYCWTMRYTQSGSQRIQTAPKARNPESILSVPPATLSRRAALPLDHSYCQAVPEYSLDPAGGSWGFAHRSTLYLSRLSQMET